LIDNFKKSQKEVADLLGITESAVSQYLKEKRGRELKFNKTELNKISNYAEKIVKDTVNMSKYLFQLSQELRGTKSLCKLHREQDSSVEKNCKICYNK